MSDTIPEVSLGLGEGDARLVFVDDEHVATDIAGLLKVAPGLLQPAAARRLALAVNHFAQGDAFEVINEPATFAEQYKTTLAAEDPKAPWQEGVVRLSDYGVPDFDRIAAPSLSGQVLQFFAVDTFLGLPYRVEVDLGSTTSVGDDDYRALDLSPLAVEVAPARQGELTDEDKAFLQSLATTGGSGG